MDSLCIAPASKHLFNAAVVASISSSIKAILVVMLKKNWVFMKKFIPSRNLRAGDIQMPDMIRIGTHGGWVISRD